MGDKSWVNLAGITIYAGDTIVVAEGERPYVVRRHDGYVCRRLRCRVPAWMHVTRRTF